MVASICSGAWWWLDRLSVNPLVGPAVVGSFCPFIGLGRDAFRAAARAVWLAAALAAGNTDGLGAPACGLVLRGDACFWMELGRLEHTVAEAVAAVLADQAREL